MKKFLTYILTIFVTTGILTQSDEPCTAPALTVTAGCVNTAVNMAGATASGAPTPAWSCSGTTNPDVWFTVTIPASGYVNNLTSGGTGDHIIAVYSGACNALVPVDCDDDDGPSLQSQLLPISGHDKQTRLSAFQRVPFLCIDEVHTVEAKHLAVLESIIDDRYGNRRPTMLIGIWMTPEGICSGQTVNGRRINGLGETIMDRINEHTKHKTGGVVWCRWDSYRQ